MLQKLSKRVLELSFKHKLAHIGSCLTALPIIYDIYEAKAEDDIFILSNGHAGLALYVVLENKYGVNAEVLFLKHGVHPCRDDKIYCSTGSLGMGIAVAVGAAIADTTRKVYCLISDGECAEGVVWEALTCWETHSLHNLLIHVNMNGYSACAKVNKNRLIEKLLAFCPSIIIHKTSNYLSSLKDLDAHYHVLTQEEYELCQTEIDCIS
jgi:transketolase